MLVLSRKIDESIIIDDGRIIVKVIDIGGGKVRIGIEADRSVKVLRSELLEKKTDD